MSFNFENPFNDLSLQGQAKNPLQLLVNPMAVGTVGLATLKDQDNKTGWFSNLFKPKTSSTGNVASNVTGATESNKTTLYIVFGVVIFILIVAVMSSKKKAV
jgi:hypothetical protein